MARTEREHEILSEPLDDRLIARRATEGWAPVAVVWEREAEGEAPARRTETVPYGMRVAADCSRLEQDQREVETMIAMLRMIVDEMPFAEIAERLNARGLRTRPGAEWNQTSVFHMLPRLIEVAPEIYSTAAWHQLRLRMAAV